MYRKEEQTLISRARVAMEQECTLSPKSLLSLDSRQRRSGAITRIAIATDNLVHGAVAKPAVLRQQ
jgi:hypothetical protein